MFNNAGLGERSLMALSSSSMAAGLYSNRVSHDTSSPSSSARPTGEQAPAAAAATAAAVLTDADLVKEREIMLQETETIFLWELPGGMRLCCTDIVQCVTRTDSKVTSGLDW